MTDLTEALRAAVAAAREAGALLLARLHSGEGAARETDARGEEHCAADLLAERLLRARLSAVNPAWGLRAEEEPHLNSPPEEPDGPFWLIDPNDGTSAFLKGERGASVSIALVVAGRPALGVIFAYGGLDDDGDLFEWAEGCGPLRRNGRALDPSRGAGEGERGGWRARWEEAVVFVSNQGDELAEAYAAALGGARFRVAPGVAYRLALAAAGEGEAAISLAGPRDFDVAAGHALLRGAGGTLIDERGREARYLSAAPTRLGFCFGGAPAAVARLAATDWRPLLTARRRRDLPFARPSRAALCPHAEWLRAAQGAWWGWHLGYALMRSLLMSAGEEGDERGEGDGEGPAALPALWRAARAAGCDHGLLMCAREALCAPAPRAPDHPLSRLLAARAAAWASAPLARHDGGAGVTAEDRWRARVAALAARGEPQGLPEALAALGFELRLGYYPERAAGELLAWREGPPLTWGTDAARLAERLALALAPPLA